MDHVSEPVVVHAPRGDLDEALARKIRQFIAEVCEVSKDEEAGQVAPLA
jgi:hypothetical protein